MFNGSPFTEMAPNPFNTPFNYPTGSFGGYDFRQAYSQSDPTKKINPGVLKLIEPIVKPLTEFARYKDYNPQYSMWNPNNSMSEAQKKNIEMKKKECVHLIKGDSGEIEGAIEDYDENFFKCKICDRLIYKKFDDTAIQKLQDAIPVLNQLVFFGMPLNLGPEQLSKIIFIKQNLYDVIQLEKGLISFVKNEDNALSHSNTFGDDNKYATFKNTNGILSNGYSFGR